MFGSVNTACTSAAIFGRDSELRLRKRLLSGEESYIQSHIDNFVQKSNGVTFNKFLKDAVEKVEKKWHYEVLKKNCSALDVIIPKGQDGKTFADWKLSYPPQAWHDLNHCTMGEEISSKILDIKISLDCDNKVEAYKLALSLASVLDENRCANHQDISKQTAQLLIKCLISSDVNQLPEDGDWWQNNGDWWC